MNLQKGQIETAWKFYNAMQQRWQLRPDAITFVGLLLAASRNNEPLDSIEQLEAEIQFQGVQAMLVSIGPNSSCRQ